VTFSAVVAGKANNTKASAPLPPVRVRFVSESGVCAALLSEEIPQGDQYAEA
jgi:hypothetical protein